MSNNSQEVKAILPSVNTPTEFNFEKPETWPIWLKRFERYISIANLRERPESEKIDVLLYTMGEKAEEILTQITSGSNATTTLKAVTDKFTEYFFPKKNTIFERYKFNSRKQQIGESVDTFVTALYSLAETCEYGALKEELIRDRIVIGVRHARTSERLQLMADLTLEKALKVARQAEVQVKEGRLIREEEAAEDSELNRIAQRRENRNDKKSGKKEYENCGRCGRLKHADYKKCPALKSTCNNCQKIGHWEKACRSKKVRRIEEQVSQEEEEDEDTSPNFLGAVCDTSQDNKEFLFRAYIRELSRQVNFIIDTGADVSCVSANMLPDKYKDKISKTDRIIVGPDGKRLSVAGYLYLSLEKGNSSARAKIYVLNELKQNLLGKPEIRKFKLVSKINALQLKCKTRVQPFTEFPKVFEGLGAFKKVLKIQLKEEYTPFFQSVPRTVPIPLLKKLKIEIDKLVKEGILKSVDFPTEWCSPIVVIPKKDTDQIRICGDFTKLNKSVKRAHFPIPKINITLSNFKGSKIFSKIDVKTGFYQIKLKEDSQPLTTIITPYGRYMFTRLPFGINCSPDYFTQWYSEILRDIQGVEIHTDDVIIHGATMEEHDKRLRRVLNILQKEGITLNKNKCIFGVEKIEFLGHEISEKGISILPKRIKAIASFPTPKDKKTLMQFLGAANYVSKFVPHKSQLLEPLNALLKDNVQFVWLEAQEKAFNDLKNLLKMAPTLSHYDFTKKVVIQADASSYGLGAALMQINAEDKREIVAYASCTLTEAEKRYSQIEKEALALAFATEHFKDYITGIDIMLETDHKPLIQILQSKSLDDLTPRLQRIRLRLMRYSYDIIYVPGKQLLLADCLSRNPINRTESKYNDEWPREIENYVNFVVSSVPASRNMLDKIKKEQSNDYICVKLKEYSLGKWPDKNKLEDGLLPFYNLRENISFGKELLLYNSRIIIPPNLQMEILSKLHEGHLGISRCRELAKQSVWWPGISNQLKILIENCPNCIEQRRNIKEPFVKENFPERPWQKVAMDLFKFQEKWYLILTDYYSRYFEILSLKSLTEETVIKKTKKVFARFGVPEIVRTDPGTQFATKFKKFAKEFDFKHIESSPKYSQSNGEAESAVKIAKMILKKCKDVAKGLLAYRSTPLENGYSPAELMFSRKVRSLVPMFPAKLGTFIDHKKIAKVEKERKEKQETNYNKRHRVKKLSELTLGDKVWIIDKRVYAKIVGIDENPNSFSVETEKGRVIRRNRWHLIYAPYKDDEESEVREKDPVYLEEDVGLRDEGIGDEQMEEGELNSGNEVIGADRINSEDKQSSNQRPKRERKPNPRYRDYV